ncbi:MAG TPA: MarR family transcriptional regulator [Gemmatimonadales bacterium]|nr:MarR family transcriptional regulator [Gemmatimonadales bacterium]
MSEERLRALEARLDAIERFLTKRKRPLTTKQAAVLEYVESCIQLKGKAPTIEEIRRHLGLRAASTVSQHLEQLTAKGWLERAPHAARGLMLPVEAERIPA